MAPPKPGSPPVQSLTLPSAVRGGSNAGGSGRVDPPPAGTCVRNTGSVTPWTGRAEAAAGATSSQASAANHQRMPPSRMARVYIRGPLPSGASVRFSSCLPLQDPLQPGFSPARRAAAVLASLPVPRPQQGKHVGGRWSVPVASNTYAPQSNFTENRSLRLGRRSGHRPGGRLPDLHVRTGTRGRHRPATATDPRCSAKDLLPVRPGARGVVQALPAEREHRLVPA